MTADTAARHARTTDNWTPARMFMALSAGYHLLLAGAGFAIDQTFPVGAASAAHAGSGHVFGIFETNGWHSLAALLVGVISLYFAVRPRNVRSAALAVGLSQAGVLVAFAVVPPSTFWFASNGADQIVHAATAIGGIASAMVTATAERTGTRVA